MAEIIYVLTNEAMPDLVKIGRTADSLETRIATLSSSTSVPVAFECYFAVEVPDAAKIEKTLHQLFAEHRVNPRREFFRIDPEKAVLALSLGSFKEITPGEVEIDSEEQKALSEIKARRPRLNLEAIGVTPGAVLTLSRDEAITARVVEGGKVDFRGAIMSLSAAAHTALQELGFTSLAVSGPGYWMFEGELLDERRRRMETERFTSNDTE